MKAIKSLKTIIISRPDNIGDVVLTLPMIGFIKTFYPDVKIMFLARDYVRAVVEADPLVDGFISLNQLQEQPFARAKEMLASTKADMIIHVAPNKEVAKLAYAARIPYRVGTSHRWYHWFWCNYRINFSRKNSELHESQLNFQLLEPLGLNLILPLATLAEHVRFTHLQVDTAVQDLIKPSHFNLIIHPLTNGNTREWPLASFSELIEQLSSEKFNIIVTGSTKEHALLSPLLTRYPHIKNAVGLLSLAQLLQLFQQSQGLLANSTGPLHIAGVLGIHALGLFPNEPGKDPGRWAPLGEKADYLVAEASNMETITPTAVAERILTWVN